jgi:CheY-like chemotaxis protein/HPt (histidine-containing phosphotransfer) domain-containing protein
VGCSSGPMATTLTPSRAEWYWGQSLIVFAVMNIDRAPVRIMVVDDDDVSREVIALLLEEEGYAVDTAVSGDAALLRLETGRGSLPEVVLTDVQMPGIAGGELARRLRGVCGSGVVLLAMSGSMPEEELRRGFDGFLMKPFKMADVAAALAGCSAKAVSGGIVEGGVILNEAVYEKLAGSMRPARLEQLYALCLEDAEKRVAGMRRAATDGDDAAYRREAHAIKGGCGMVGADELQKLATSMETRGLDDTNHVASLAEFTLACERLRRMLVARSKA